MHIFFSTDYEANRPYLFRNYSRKDLTAERVERMERLREPIQKERFLLAEYITLELLREEFRETEVRIFGKTGEKPVLCKKDGTPGKMTFSRSYGGNHLALAFGNGEKVGIDCEAFLTPDRRVMEYFFTGTERRFVSESRNPSLLYTLIWTRKESCMKYTGEGLSFPFQNLETLEEDFSEKDIRTIPPGFQGNLTFPAPVRTRDVCIRSFIIADTVCSVCGSPSAMDVISYQEKRTYEKNHNRLF